jgi:hypothetical protein
MTDKWIICPACRGEGTCVNPNIDANGLSAEDFADDPDFADDYMSGAYDVTCAACHGSGKIKQSHVKTLRQNAADRRLAAMEDGDWEGVSHARDWRYG